MDGEFRLQADGAAVHAEQSGCDGVKRAAPQLFSAEPAPACAVFLGEVIHPPQNAIHPPHHLTGRSARKCQQQNPRRIHAAGDQVSDTMGERRRLTRPRSRDNEQRIATMFGGGALLLVEAAEYFIDDRRQFHRALVPSVKDSSIVLGGSGLYHDRSGQ